MRARAMTLIEAEYRCYSEAPPDVDESLSLLKVSKQRTLRTCHLPARSAAEES
jgi:hypothetical protein